jgi:hypothetical protein
MTGPWCWDKTARDRWIRPLPAGAVTLVLMPWQDVVTPPRHFVPGFDD